MNKTAIKNFAVWARRKLIGEITYKAGLIGINEKGIAAPLPISSGNLQFFDIGTGEPIELSGIEIQQRDALIRRIHEKEKTSDYATAFRLVIEEVAYTWFNRLVAIRFMEVNDYLPSRVRVLSSETEGKAEPDMVTRPFETDMQFTPHEREQIICWKDENKLDELFRMLFIKQCNKLNEVLPELFEKTDDYTEFLLNISFTDSDGIVNHLVNDIEETDFTEAVEIIGWLYQYYNIEPKDEVFALLKKNIKITKERIPAVTQLFTPDWIVRYMVQNSLGRLWIERERALSGISDQYLNGSYFGWKYYLEEAEQEESVQAELDIIRQEYKHIKAEDIKVIDPCMGSGHILVYAFEVLMQIYETQGYTQRDAAQAIIENNLYGLDIDDRAYQLAYFAVMMQARKYDRRFLTKKIAPKLYSIQESNNINKAHLQYFGNTLEKSERNTAIQQMEYLLDTYYDAKEYGSILKVKNCNWELLEGFVNDFKIDRQIAIDNFGIEQLQVKLKELIVIGEAMAQQYDVVATNPPYMSASGMGRKLSEYVKSNYLDSKTDLYAVFIERCGDMIHQNRYQAMITMHSWMFLSSYDKLREKLLYRTLVNLAHLGARAFEEIDGEVVQTVAFIMFMNNFSNYLSTYIRLVGISNPTEKETEFLLGTNRFYAAKESFFNIPNCLFAYWFSPKMLHAFNRVTFGKIGDARQGLATSDNNRFVRLWHEVSNININYTCKNCEDTLHVCEKWFPFIKGGSFRRWYPNKEHVVNYKNDGMEIKHSVMRKYPYLKNPYFVVKNTNTYFKKGISWSDVSTANFSARYVDDGYIYADAGPMFFPYRNDFFILAYMNTKVYQVYLDLICQGLHYSTGHIPKTPYIPVNCEKMQYTEKVAIENLNLSRFDWDSFETSWDFKRHPLLAFGYQNNYGLVNSENRDNVPALKFDFKYRIFEIEKGEPKHPTRCKIEHCYEAWKIYCNEQFNKLQANEEELNRIFIEIYGLQDELTPEVADKDVTIARIYDSKEEIPESMKGNKYVLTKQDVIKSFVSYAVGCMFGRYSLDSDGLAYAGGAWDDNKYMTFIPDKDNCIPITDEEYFADDIVGLFVAFVKKAYGEGAIEENLDFIANALGNKGDTAREIIRNYFIKDFYKDHVKTYQKRPIYWLYDSGKQDGFKALIYMHRYHTDTTGIVRVNYLHKVQQIYQSEIERMQDMIEHSSNAREAAQAEKRKAKLVKQLQETKEYDEKIAHIALSRIAIDLDDGVKVNYEKVQTEQDGQKLAILAKL